MATTAQVLAIAPGILRTYGLSFLLLPFNVFSTYYLQAVLRPGERLRGVGGPGLVLSGGSSWPCLPLWRAGPVVGHAHYRGGWWPLGAAALMASRPGPAGREILKTPSLEAMASREGVLWAGLQFAVDLRGAVGHLLHQGVHLVALGVEEGQVLGGLRLWVMKSSSIFWVRARVFRATSTKVP